MTAVPSGCLELAMSPGVEYPACCGLREVIMLDFQRCEVPCGVCKLITVLLFFDLSPSAGLQGSPTKKRTVV